MTFGENKQVTEMLDSNELYEKRNFSELRKKLEMEGYLFIRSVIPKQLILDARHAMLTQAAKDGSIVVNEQTPLNNGRMSKQGTKFAAGYCVDGITGSETNERANIDVDAWSELGPSAVCQHVYNGEHLQKFWKSLFGEQATNPLVKQTFLRLMGNSGTVQHADYYYFKRDTHVFSGRDGRAAQLEMEQYLKANHLWDSQLYEMDEYDNSKREKRRMDELKEEDEDAEDDGDDPNIAKNSDTLVCAICRSVYDKSELDEVRRNRLNTKEADFGIEGEWHCPVCALKPLSIYTTWISLSQLKSPKDSILAMVPYSHKLKMWDLPLKNAQVPADFHWKLNWVIPKQVDYGDIVIFNIKTIHASSLNKSSPRCYRCSFDTRLQLIPNDPALSKDNDAKQKSDKVNAKQNRKNAKRKTMRSPHPGLKLKSVAAENDGDEDGEQQQLNDENDISESIQSLALSEK